MLIHVNCTDYWASLCNLQMYVCFDQILPPSTLSCPFLTFSLPITGPFTDTGTLVNFHLFSYIFPSSLYQLAYLPPVSFFPMFSVFTVFVSCIICHFWFDKVSLCSLSWQPTLSSPFSAFWLFADTSLALLWFLTGVSCRLSGCGHLLMYCVRAFVFGASLSMFVSVELQYWFVTVACHMCKVRMPPVLFSLTFSFNYLIFFVVHCEF